MSTVPSDPLMTDPLLSGATDSASLARKSGRGRRCRAIGSSPTMRVTAMLGSEHSVTVSGPDLDLRRVITLLNDTLTRARKADSQNMSLATFLSLLRDQAASTLRDGQGS